MATQPNLRIQVTQRFNAPAERVFDAWLDPETARKWLFATPEGAMVRAEIDPQVGGSFLFVDFVDRRAGVNVEHTGEYMEIDRPSRLVFTFSVDGSSPDAITVDIVPLDHGCKLTLTHEMASEWADYVERTRQGWTTILEGLTAAVA